MLRINHDHIIMIMLNSTYSHFYAYPFLFAPSYRQHHQQHPAGGSYHVQPAFGAQNSTNQIQVSCLSHHIIISYLLSRWSLCSSKHSAKHTNTPVVVAVAAAVDAKHHHHQFHQLPRKISCFVSRQYYLSAFCPATQLQQPFQKWNDAFNFSSSSCVRLSMRS